MLYALNYETRAVLGRVTPQHVQPKTHAVGLGSGRVLCGTVDPGHLADRYATSPQALPTCAKCLAELKKKTAVA